LTDTHAHKKKKNTKNPSTLQSLNGIIALQNTLGAIPNIYGQSLGQALVTGGKQKQNKSPNTRYKRPSSGTGNGDEGQRLKTFE
jgi:hypothetical protein